MTKSVGNEVAHQTPVHLNGVVNALAAGRSAFATFSRGGVEDAIAMSGAMYDAVIVEMEHNPLDMWGLRNYLQYLLDRRQILNNGTLSPGITPLVRIPANGGEMNQWLAKQVLDSGAYGVVWPHVSTVAEARNAVAACRYPRPAEAEYFDPPGIRGDAPSFAARYFGLDHQEYYKRADVWPLNPLGEILVVIQVEERRAVDNLDQILEEVPGIAVVLIGEGDLSQDLGHPRQYDHPEVRDMMSRTLRICNEHRVACGHPHATVNNVERLVHEGFRFLMTAPERSYEALNVGRRVAER